MAIFYEDQDEDGDDDGEGDRDGDERARRREELFYINLKLFNTTLYLAHFNHMYIHYTIKGRGGSNSDFHFWENVVI